METIELHLFLDVWATTFVLKDDDAKVTGGTVHLTCQYWKSC